MMYTRFMTRTQIYLPNEQINYFRQRAIRESVTVSEAIRRTFDECIPIKPKKNVGRVLVEMAIDAKKRGVKGPKDLATNLDKYLYGQDFR